MNTSSNKQVRKVISINPYFCFASCLEIVVEYLTGLRLDQYIVTEYLGVAIPSEDQHLFTNFKKEALKITSSSKEWGVNVDTNKINNLLEKNSTALKCEFKSIYHFEEWSLEEELKSLLKDNGIVIIGFDYHTVFDNNKSSVVGHAVVGLEVMESGKELFIKVFDPGPDNAGVKLIKLEDIFIAAKRKGGGIWTFLIK